MHQRTKMICIYFKIHTVLFILSFIQFCSIVTELWLILWTLNPFKGYNSCTTESSLIKLDVHQQVIYIYTKFHEIQFSSYLVMAQVTDGKMDRQTDRRTDGRTWRKQYPSTFGPAGKDLTHTPQSDSIKDVQIPRLIAFVYVYI